MGTQLSLAFQGRSEFWSWTITNDIRGFEYRMSAELFSRLKRAGIGLATADLLRPRTDDEHASLFEHTDLDFNTLLRVAHGAPEVGEIEVSKIRILGRRSNWYELASLSSSLTNKLLGLAVCHSFSVQMR